MKRKLRSQSREEAPNNKGRHKKKQVFFGVSPKGGGGLAESKISLTEKTEIFLDFFAERGGVSPNPKGFYQKNEIFWHILAYFAKNWAFFGFFFV